MKRISSLLFWLVCSLFFALVLTACQSATPALTVSTAAVPTSGLPTPGVNQMRQAITNALVAMNTQPTRLEITTTVKENPPRQSTVEAIPAMLRMHIITQDAETIVVGGRVYLKENKTAPWRDSDLMASSYFGTTPSAQDILDSLGSVKFIRQDALNGKPVVVYQYASTTTASEATVNSQTELWLDKTSLQPVKMVIDSETISVSDVAAAGKTPATPVKTLTTMLITLDPAIKIESPLP